MAVEVTIVCDVCGILGDAGKTAAKVRAVLADEHGWKVALPGGRDLCRECGSPAESAL